MGRTRSAQDLSNRETSLLHEDQLLYRHTLIAHALLVFCHPMHGCTYTPDKQQHQKFIKSPFPCSSTLQPTVSPVTATHTQLHCWHHKKTMRVYGKGHLYRVSTNKTGQKPKWGYPGWDLTHRALLSIIIESAFLLS